MSYFIQQSDRSLICQRLLDIRIRLDVYDDSNSFVDSIECGLVSGGCTIDATSAARRTANFTLIPNKKINTLIEEHSLIWLNRTIVIYIGIKNLIKNDYVWYKQGKFYIQDFASTYDATTNELTINVSDAMSKLDGSKNGQLGALITSFPAYKEYLKSSETNHLLEGLTLQNTTFVYQSDELKNIQKGHYFVIQMPENNPAQPYLKINDNDAMPIVDALTGVALSANVLRKGCMYSVQLSGNNTFLLSNPLPIEKLQDGTPLVHYIIRDAIITVLTRLGNIKDYNVDDVGEYYAMPEYNKNYLEYRKSNPLWNSIPYDLEFNIGDNVFSILSTMRDLYPNYEMFFDENGTFVTQMIPSTKEDDIYIDNDFLQRILISENFNIDANAVKNVSMVWGKNLDINFKANSCVLEDDTYTIDIDEYGEEWLAGDYLAITFDKTNPMGAKVKLHSKFTVTDGQTTSEKEADLPAIPLMDQLTDLPLLSKTIIPGATYVCKVKTIIEDNEPKKYLYFLSQYQPQAINVLTDGSVSEEKYTCANGKIVPMYSMEYFQDFYNCRVVSFTVEPKSPFTIQKLGVILNVFSGDEFDNIESDQRALARAEYENWKTCILTDQITLVTKLCPWLDVNKKVSYKRSDKEETEQYLIQSVTHDPAAGTSSIVMNRFRPLYMNEDHVLISSNRALAEYTHKELSNYTHHLIWKGR